MDQRTQTPDIQQQQFPFFISNIQLKGELQIMFQAEMIGILMALQSGERRFNDFKQWEINIQAGYLVWISTISLQNMQNRTEYFLYEFQHVGVEGNDKVDYLAKWYGSRKYDSAISRLWIGHTSINYSLFIKGKIESEKCAQCGLPETVEHVLIQCQIWQRQNSF